MRWSSFYLFTTREVPSDAEVVSHRLMLRSGMIRKTAAGIYSYLPLGLRSLTKLMTIVRRELQTAGSVELSMPAIQPAELWQESGRWSQYGKELLRMQDRHSREFCFGPTHEEVITDIVRHDAKSYRQLPLNVFQIQTKFRDEIRPRFGLMRGREFLMKDAYSFHASDVSLEESYELMSEAYERIFSACQLEFVRVEADTGSIGGSFSHEFMVVADTGESVVARCSKCGYGANQEKAGIGNLVTGGDADNAGESDGGAGSSELRLVETPGQRTVEDVAMFLGVEPLDVVKTLLYEVPDGLVAVVVRGDREVNEVKLTNYLGAEWLRLAAEDVVEKATGAPVGFAGPVSLPPDVRLVGDESARLLDGFVCGANRADAHYVGVSWQRDASPEAWADLALAQEGDPCPNCRGSLALARGIEVGHIFKLGTKYSEPMKCIFTDENGKGQPMIMGCYGLGIGRTVAAAIEQNHDEQGIVWPLPLAPFEVAVLPLSMKSPEVVQVAERLYEDLKTKGVDAFLDDRKERPGVKFKDSELIGFPVRVVVGEKSLAEEKVEVSCRRDGEKELVSTDQAVTRVVELLGSQTG